MRDIESTRADTPQPSRRHCERSEAVAFPHVLSPKTEGGVRDGEKVLVDVGVLTVRFYESRSACQHGFAVASMP
jgi:hypothetical protein